jgi:hypothetical protein
MKTKHYTPDNDGVRLHGQNTRKYKAAKKTATKELTAERIAFDICELYDTINQGTY